MELLLVLLTAASAESLYHECKDGHYLDNTQLMERLEEIATNFPDLASTYTIGFSARGEFKTRGGPACRYLSNTVRINTT